VLAAVLVFAACVQPLAMRAAAPALPEYVLIDVGTGRTLEARWDDPDRPVPIGSLIKPFTALAYASAHGESYPTFECPGRDRCWLPAGHGRVGLIEAIAHSCNAYFDQLAKLIAPDTFLAVLQRFGFASSRDTIQRAAMVGLGDELELSPNAVAHAYAELVSRAGQPGVAAILRGMRTSAIAGTGRGVDAAIGRHEALVKTGTAPCAHSARARGDGYAVVLYPADRPRAVLLVHAHGRTGAETATEAGGILMRALTLR
jgi:cell division protein FtsI/penicillin-binding protein 2